ncbi:MAG: tetratricopeptide repeat protein [Elusimicrobia bacterium]|nr:tetratricopeptide repeat protein [Elusimicrobiota bacterium]
MNSRVANLLLVGCFFVTPLVFFTNLTRNPYVTQICLLNILLCAAVGARFLWGWGTSGSLRLPRTALDLPIAAACVVAAASWLVGFLGHQPFFRPAIVSEGTRITIFALVNALFPFYLAAALGREEAEADKAPILRSKPGNRGPAWDEYPVMRWAAFALVWGALWALFPQMRSARASNGIWAQVWDGYGALLWAAGFAGAAWLARAGRMLDYLHLALAAGFLASAYGVLQYFNVEFIWPSILNPYGGRSVSTFGNPNFLSSYNVVLMPIAGALFLHARTWSRQAVYGTLLLTMGAAILASLTRSSWGGTAVAMTLLLSSRDMRARVMEAPRAAGLVAGITVMILALWPESRVAGSYHPSVVGRIAEIKTFSEADGYYSPFHQRLLIWTCSWLMGAENPVTGKGWGLFELFYPFYQGHLLDSIPFFRTMRTHANNSHNEIMEVWAQAGILGLGVLFWLWTTFFRSTRPRWTSFKGIREGLGLAAACGVGGMLADNLLNVSLHFAMPAFMFWWAAGMAVSVVYPPDRPWRTTGGPAPAPWQAPALARAAAWAGGALLACIAWYWVSTWFREVHYFEGFKLMRQGSVAAAVKELERSKAWGPREVNAIYELGNAYARLERFQDADRVYADAMRANAGYDEIYFNLGTIKSSRLGLSSQAEPYYRSAVAINPISQDVYAALSALYLQSPLRRLDEAEAMLAKAMRVFPRNPNHWNNMGFVLSNKKRWVDAEAAYVRALELEPALRIAESNLRSVLQQSKRPEPPVLRALDALRELERRLTTADYSERSLELAVKTAQALPESSKARFMLGTILLARGRYQEAALHLEWASSRDPGLLGARLNLARAYMRLSRKGDAARELSAVLALDPANTDARMGLSALGKTQ